MTKRQADVVKFVKKYIVAHGYCPTYREIGEAIGVVSLATVHKHLHNLQAKGKVTLGGGKQSIQIVTQPAKSGRFEFEGPHHLWDKLENCYWVREKAVNND